MKLIKQLLMMVASLLMANCAVLHHIQVGPIDDRQGSQVSWIPFEIMVSEVGVSMNEIADMTRPRSRDLKTGNTREEMGLADYIALFQQGPRTGKPVYSEKYADKIMYQVYEKCPSGKVTGLVSIREMRNYPVISGEIVKLTGFCLKPKS